MAAGLFSEESRRPALPAKCRSRGLNRSTRNVALLTYGDRHSPYATDALPKRTDSPTNAETCREEEERCDAEPALQTQPGYGSFVVEPHAGWESARADAAR